MKKYLNQKGSAMILVLASLIILTAVCSVVVMISAANISTSRKYSDWSEEYYNLDYAVEERLADFDRSTLVPAENMAREYLQNGYYQHEYGVASSLGGFPADVVSSDLHTLLYEEWMLRVSPILYEDEVDPEGAAGAYEQALEVFVDKAFEVLYSAYLDAKVDEYVAGGEIVFNNVPTGIGMNNPDWFLDAGDYSLFSDLHNDLGDMPNIGVSAWDDTNEKRVDAQITVTLPSYESVIQRKLVAIKVNPLYLNALSVGGSISFTGTSPITVCGDVVANNALVSTQAGTQEGNAYGIKTDGQTQVTIYGNVSTAGDLHIRSSGSTIAVKPYSEMPSALGIGFSTVLKQNFLYGNNYFINTQGLSLSGYTEDSAPLGVVPYVYDDSLGGNVYCNNLAIENGCQNARLSVSGSVWTQDDVQNDGGPTADISIAGNYIGMRSSAYTYIDQDTSQLITDHNGSSTVINNAFIYGGTISIDGSYIIPGTAWYEFEGKSAIGGAVNWNRVYYQTAESVSAQAGEFFQIYQASGDEVGLAGYSNIFSSYYVDSEEYYDLFERDEGSAVQYTLSDRMDRFIDRITSGLSSGVNILRDVSRYVLGTGVNSAGNQIQNGTGNENYVAYSAVNGGLLPEVFASKTKYYGTGQYSIDELTDSVYGKNDSENGFYWYGGSTTHNVDINSSGIIYCAGNLTLTGSGTFRGSVICAGNLTVSSGVTIVYDDTVIMGVLGADMLNEDGFIDVSSGSRIARLFFSPSGYSMGVSLGTEEISTISAEAGERVEEVKRYVINSWKESRHE